jgi:hypothetical protein
VAASSLVDCVQNDNNNDNNDNNGNDNHNRTKAKKVIHHNSTLLSYIDPSHPNSTTKKTKNQEIE